MNTEKDQNKALNKTDVSSSYSKKTAFENIEQMLIEKIADFLDSEEVVNIENEAGLKDPIKREESLLHIRMAQSAIREYKITVFGI